MLGGFDSGGLPQPMTADLLTSIAAGWPVTGIAPEGVNRLLETSRTLWGLAWFEYDLMTVSASWSLVAVEAVLAERLGLDGKAEFAKSIKMAKVQGLIDEDWAERLDAGRRLRNGLMHARCQSIWSLGMAAPIVKASHEITALLFPKPG